MHDSVAAWMIAGGVRSETADRNMSHRVAIHEARVAADAARPGLLDRFRARVRTENTTPALDCCAA
jgi:hypothetical protein